MWLDNRKPTSARHTPAVDENVPSAVEAAGPEQKTKYSLIDE
jgi:hypothetical protein